MAFLGSNIASERKILYAIKGDLYGGEFFFRRFNFLTLSVLLGVFAYLKLGCGYFFAQLVLILFFVLLAVLWGIVLPVYSTFKAIERKNENDQQKWLMYWAAYGSFSLVEVFTDKLISWFPMYYHVKFAFLVWLQLPTAEGANQLYKNHLRPFLLRHHGRFDLLVGFAYGEMVRFYSRHQAEIGYAKTILLKIMGSAGIMPKAKSNRPGHPQIEDSSPTISDDDDD